MNYYELLEEKAKLGLDELLEYIKTDRNLLFTLTTNDTEDVISIEIEAWDGDTYNSEFLCSYEFDDQTRKLLD